MICVPHFSAYFTVFPFTLPFFSFLTSASGLCLRYQLIPFHFHLSLFPDVAQPTFCLYWQEHLSNDWKGRLPSNLIFSELQVTLIRRFMPSLEINQRLVSLYLTVKWYNTKVKKQVHKCWSLLIFLFLSYLRLRGTSKWPGEWLHVSQWQLFLLVNHLVPELPGAEITPSSTPPVVLHHLHIQYTKAKSDHLSSGNNGAAQAVPSPESKLTEYTLLHDVHFILNGHWHESMAIWGCQI